jgi:hypothetical protein
MAGKRYGNESRKGFVVAQALGDSENKFMLLCSANNCYLSKFLRFLFLLLASTYLNH